MSEFSKWREDEEKSSKSMFIATTSMKKLRDGSSRMYLSCHRSGSYKSKSLGKRKLKAQGSCKINRCCPASMKVEERKGRVTVHYFKTHYGHTNDLGDITHLRLTESERALIAGKLAQGMTFEHLLDDLQSSSHGKFNRFHLLTKKDLYNIQRNFKLQQKPSSKEAETLESWLEKSLVQGEQSPVLYCKDRGVEDDDEGLEGVLELDDFLLVLANPLQRDMLAQFGPNAVCIDCSDMGITQEIALTTLVVVDEFGDPFPVAFCLSNRIDFAAFRCFFNALRKRVGNIAASILVSDDIPALYGAWGQVMGEYEHHLLCPWFTEKCWKNLIAKIPRAMKAKRSTVHRWMKTLMEMSEIDLFHEELTTFLDEMMQDKDTETFVSHFKSQFALRPEMWAHCFLGPKWTKIIGNLEVMHRSLRNAFCQGKDFGHVVRCLKSLNKLVRDRNCNRLAKAVENGKENELGDQLINGASNASVLVEVVDDDHTWRFQGDSEEFHQVQRISQVCIEEDCDMQTTCSHCYSCTCIEYLAYSKCCQHIDTVAQLQQCPQLLTPVSPTWEKSEQPEKSLECRVEEKVETLLGFLKKGKFGETTLNQMEQQIDSWINGLKSVTRSTTENKVNEKVQSETSNVNNNIVLLIPVCPPSMNLKVPISRYKSPLDRSNNRTAAIQVHSGFDHVY